MTNHEAVLFNIKDYIENSITIFEKKRDNTDSLYKFEEIKGILKCLEFVLTYIEYLEIAYDVPPCLDDVDIECHSFDSGVYDNSENEGDVYDK